MSREIKFRCWHTAKKDAFEIKMRKSHMIYFDFYEYADDQDGEYGGGYIDLKTKPVMQYTNLKDKNGIEIYEGDIIKDFQGRILMVYWDEPCAMFSGNNNDKAWLGACDFYRSEIIGNIYENPELLEG